MVAAFNPKDAQAPRDEREKLIELKATRVGYAGLVGHRARVLLRRVRSADLLFNANALLFILVTAEILRSACQIIQHRRAA